MKLSEVLTGSLTYDQASAIFAQHGVNVAGMSPEALKLARNKLIMKHHTDLGGSNDVAQSINAAYDLLKKPESQWRGYDATEAPRPSPRQSRQSTTPIWAMAGHSGGHPPNATIYRNNYTDVNFIKKSMWELSGQSKTEYTINGFDGHFFRDMVTVYGSPKIFNHMANAMIDWQTKGGNPYECRAVFVNSRKSKTLYLVYADGKFYGDDPIPVPHESFNMNPSNDQNFVRHLPEWLDQLRKGTVGDPSRQ